MHSEFARGLLFGGRAERIEIFHDANLFKTEFRQPGDHLCLRQSAGDSTRPQVDIAPIVLTKIDLDGDIRQLQAATGAEDTKNL